MEKLTEEQILKLRKPLPDEAVSQHPTKTYLSSIKAIYVIERLNEVFGIGSWKSKPFIVSEKDGMVVLRVEFSVPSYGIELESFGGNDNGGQGSKNFDLGDAYKGAMTDAMTKIASFLEIGMDVFKGKQKGKGKGSSSNSESKQEENNNPWMTEELLIKALARIKGGEIGVPKKCYDAFKVNKAMRKQLDECKPDKK